MSVSCEPDPLIALLAVCCMLKTTIFKESFLFQGALLLISRAQLEPESELSAGELMKSERERVTCLATSHLVVGVRLWVFIQRLPCVFNLESVETPRSFPADSHPDMK